jgi:two-component system NtrC family sensor kinase
MLTRLSGNAKEIEIIFSDYLSILRQARQKYILDPQIQYHFMFSEKEPLRRAGENWLKQDPATSFIFFNRQGRMLVSVFEDQKGQPRSQVPAQEAVMLAEKYVQHLEKNGELAIIETSDPKKVSLVLVSRVINQKGRNVGYLEQVIDLNSNFLRRLKDRMKLELMLARETGQPILATHNRLQSLSKDFVRNVVTQKTDPFFDIELKENPYGVFFYPINWGDSRIWLALGASKSETKTVLRNVNFAFISVLGMVIIFLTKKSIKAIFYSLINSYIVISTSNTMISYLWRQAEV